MDARGAARRGRHGQGCDASPDGPSSDEPDGRDRPVAQRPQPRIDGRATPVVAVEPRAAAQVPRRPAAAPLEPDRAPRPDRRRPGREARARGPAAWSGTSAAVVRRRAASASARAAGAAPRGSGASARQRMRELARPDASASRGRPSWVANIESLAARLAVERRPRRRWRCRRSAGRARRRRTSAPGPATAPTNQVVARRSRVDAGSRRAVRAPAPRRTSTSDAVVTARRADTRASSQLLMPRGLADGPRRQRPHRGATQSPAIELERSPAPGRTRGAARA